MILSLENSTLSWFYSIVTSHTILKLINFSTELIQNDLAVSMSKALKIPGVLLACVSIVATSMSIGFLQTTLEPHLRQFFLPPVILGLMFVINGGTYAATAPCFGWLCDKISSPKYITALGSLLVAAGFCLVGPAPFFPFQT